MKIKISLIFVVFFSISYQLNGQIDSVLSNIKFEMDFRFRAEQDWDSRKSDGTFREDRSRLRYRFRTGATYVNDWYSFGFRIRTGDQRKQQDPQLTLGKGLKEFGTLPLGFEKVFFKANLENWGFWLGKNTFPFEKSNELFWSDNVFPEGVFFEKQFALNTEIINSISVKAGHFVIASNNTSLFDDAYFQGLQTLIKSGNGSVAIFPSIYLFRNIPDIPDGDHSFLLDYTIFHLGTKFKPFRNTNLTIELDYYQNLEDYTAQSDIQEILKEEKTGIVMGLQYGDLKAKRNWMFKFTYTSLQRFSILDYMSQNDWARWDYSPNNSPDGRLSNMKGAELVVAYAISDKVNLVSKYYIVEQLIPYGIAKETGQRIRFDIDIRL